MKVKIIQGSYGLHEGNAVTLINKGNYCDVSESEAKRLIALGVAENAQEDEGDDSDNRMVELSPDALNCEKSGAEGSEGYSDDEVIELVRDGNVYSFSKESLENMTMADIRELAKDVGMENVGSYKSKRTLIDALVTYSFELDDAPEPNAEDVIG